MRLIAILLTVTLIAGNALAQDALFTVPEVDQITRLLKPDTPSGPPKTGRQALDLYLKNCTAQQHPGLDEEHLIPLCLCTASNMETRFGEADILGMFGDTQKSQALRDTALRRAFSPCMQDSVYDIALLECQSSAEAQGKLKHKDKVCTCTAEGMRATLSKKAEWLTDQYIKYDKDKAPDPLALYLQSHGLSEDMTYNLSTCLQWHEWGWQKRGR
jgi:hypothetical protein